jgi:hypothetical protein
VRVTPDERDEIAASIAAHAELGPRYEAAVAEGLIERIGEEIDKRVDARLHGPGPLRVPPRTPPAPEPPLPEPAPAPSPPVARAVPAHRSAGASIMGMFLALGSMGLGVGATAVVVAHVSSAGADIVMVALIWLAIAIVNGAHARFYWPDDPSRRGR